MVYSKMQEGKKTSMFTMESLSKKKEELIEMENSQPISVFYLLFIYLAALGLSWGM